MPRTRVDVCAVLDVREDVLRCVKGDAKRAIRAEGRAATKRAIGLEVAARLAGRPDLAWTVPPFGGRRWWFTCSRCHRLVARLYLPPGARDYACRHCHGGLAYQRIDRPGMARFRRLPALLREIDEARGRRGRPTRRVHRAVRDALRLVEALLADVQRPTRRGRRHLHAVAWVEILGLTRFFDRPAA